MILCPNCRHHELAGSLFCSECGAQLITTGHLTTQSFRPNSSDTTSGPVGFAPVPASVQGEPGMETGVSLHLMESGKILNLAGRNEYSIGRGVEGQSLLPDVDLSPYEAYSEGVSRLHATLKVLQHGILITDLGSSNGTRINGQKIVPHIDYPINHGDVVALGKLKMQILIQK
jgi:pSer/pThr/pTyr-binding forkhead associated (FHA) protein